MDGRTVLVADFEDFNLRSKRIEGSMLTSIVKYFVSLLAVRIDQPRDNISLLRGGHYAEEWVYEDREIDGEVTRRIVEFRTEDIKEKASRRAAISETLEALGLDISRVDEFDDQSLASTPEAKDTRDRSRGDTKGDRQMTTRGPGDSDDFEGITRNPLRFIENQIQLYESVFILSVLVEVAGFVTFNLLNQISSLALRRELARYYMDYGMVVFETRRVLSFRKAIQLDRNIRASQMRRIMTPEISPLGRLSSKRVSWWFDANNVARANSTLDQILSSGEGESESKQTFYITYLTSIVELMDELLLDDPEIIKIRPVHLFKRPAPVQLARAVGRIGPLGIAVSDGLFIVPDTIPQVLNQFLDSPRNLEGDGNWIEEGINPMSEEVYEQSFLPALKAVDESLHTQLSDLPNRGYESFLHVYFTADHGIYFASQLYLNPYRAYAGLGQSYFYRKFREISEEQRHMFNRSFELVKRSSEIETVLRINAEFNAHSFWTILAWPPTGEINRILAIVGEIFKVIKSAREEDEPLIEEALSAFRELKGPIKKQAMADSQRIYKIAIEAGLVLPGDDTQMSSTNEPDPEAIAGEVRGLIKIVSHIDPSTIENRILIGEIVGQWTDREEFFDVMGVIRLLRVKFQREIGILNTNLERRGLILVRGRVQEVFDAYRDLQPEPAMHSDRKRDALTLYPISLIISFLQPSANAQALKLKLRLRQIEVV